MSLFHFSSNECISNLVRRTLFQDNSVKVILVDVSRVLEIVLINLGIESECRGRVTLNRQSCPHEFGP